MIGLQRHPATIIEGPGRAVLIWSSGESETITHAQAETLRSEGRVSMTISTVSDAAVALTEKICHGSRTERDGNSDT
jgi:hypothetical protein